MRNNSTKVTLAVIGQKLDDLIERLDHHADQNDEMFKELWVKTNSLMDARSRIYGAIVVLGTLVGGIGAAVIAKMIR